MAAQAGEKGRNGSAPVILQNAFLHICMFRTINNVILQISGKIAKIRAVTCYAHKEAAVVIRLFLRVQQGLPVDDIELQMPQFQIAPGADQIYDFFLFLHRLQRILEKA